MSSVHPSFSGILSALIVALFAFVPAVARAPAPTPASAPTPVQNQADAQATTSNAAINRAVAHGLAWLLAAQEPCGGWVGDVGHKQEDSYAIYDTAERQRNAGAAHVGVSALAGLALLADGKPVDTGPYADAFARLIAYLARSQDEFGYLCDGTTRMYSHSFALLFLSQVHGMTRRHAEVVEKALTKAVAFTESAQNEHGAWRYLPFTLEADLSVTVCQVQSLRAARDAGVTVSKSVIDHVVEYVRASRARDGTYYYKIYGRAAYTKTSFAINAAAVTTLHSAGIYDTDEYRGALDYISDGYAETSRFYGNHFKYWYGNYYAAQALFTEGGPRWRNYWQQLSSDLLTRQRDDGRWSDDVGPGDAFGTAIACLLLRLPAQYLPIFRR